MNNRSFLTIPIAAIAAIGGGCQAAEAANTSEQPNIIWYLIEDTSPQFLAIYNDGKGAQTPNLEKLSKV